MVRVGVKVGCETKPGIGETEPDARKRDFSLKKFELLKRVNLMAVLIHLLDCPPAYLWAILWALMLGKNP